jgi:hypothetical protein
MKSFYFSTIIAAFLFFFAIEIPAQTLQTNTPEKVEYYKVSEVRIFINNQSDILELRKRGLGFESIKLNNTSFDVMLDSYQINILKNTGYAYEILIDDVTKDYLERTRESREMLKSKKTTMTSGFGLGSMGGFYTFSEVVAQLDSMRRKYPNLITAKDSIGTSIEGRTIWAVKISDNPDIKENEPEVFYNAMTHAREQQGMMAVLYFIYYLLENYGSDPEVTYLVNNREIYFVPVINPDGYVYNEQISPKGGGMWRKNRRDNGGGIFGVDLNRNFGYMWGFDNIGSSPNSSEWNYRGKGPFSEPESQTIRDFCKSHHFLISNSFHTPLNCVYPPWNYNLKQCPDSTMFNSLIKLATVINGYRNAIYILPPENFVANGIPDDWMYGETSEKNKIFGITTEASNAVDGDWPKPERILPLAKENLYSNLVYAWGPGIIENPPYVLNGNINATWLNPKSDILKFNAVEHNPDNHTSKVYAQILNSKDSIVSETQLTQTGSTYSGTLNPNSLAENFYKVRYRQSGVDIPSNLYFSDEKKLRFTTAGPVVLDSLPCTFVYGSDFTFQPLLKNAGKTLQLNNIIVNITSEDSWVKTIFPAKVACSSLKPGQIRRTPSFEVRCDTVGSPKYINLKFSISTDGFAYWMKDTAILISPTGIRLQSSLPLTNFLDQNYPNPFNSATTITWQLAHSSRVTLKVFDKVGRTVATLVDGQRPSGKYETPFNVATLPKGLYFYQLKAGEFSQTKKMVLMK